MANDKPRSFYVALDPETKQRFYDYVGGHGIGTLMRQCTIDFLDGRLVPVDAKPTHSNLPSIVPALKRHVKHLAKAKKQAMLAPRVFNPPSVS